MKGRSILEASTVFAVYMIVTSVIPGVGSLMRWEGRVLGGSYFLGILMVALSFIAAIVSGLDFEEMGLRAENWRDSVAIGYRGFLAFLIPQFMITNFWGVGIDYREYIGSAIFLGFLVLVFTYLLTRDLGSGKKRLGRGAVVVVGGFLGLIIYFGLTLESLKTRVLQIFIWNVLVGGFAEELFFRGYIQSTVNREYGTSWSIRGTQVGPGLIVSAILYGLSRGISGRSLSWGVFAFTVGIFYGVIREASGDIVGSGSANALIDAIGATLLRVMR